MTCSVLLYRSDTEKVPLMCRSKCSDPVIYMDVMIARSKPDCALLDVTTFLYPFHTAETDTTQTKHKAKRQAT